MRSLLRSTILFAVASLVVSVSMSGCSEQGEGERCVSAKNGDADCDSGLVCKLGSELRDSSSDRCCPPGPSSNDPRCDLATPGNTAGTGTGGSSVPGEGGNAGNGPIEPPTGGSPESGGVGGVSQGGASAGAAQGGASLGGVQDMGSAGQVPAPDGGTPG